EAREHSRTGILLGSRDDAQHTPGVLVIAGAWLGPVAQVRVVDDPHRRVGVLEVESDVDELDAPAGLRAAGQVEARLPAAECDGEVRAHVDLAALPRRRIDAGRD